VNGIPDERHDLIPALSIGPFQATPLGLMVGGAPTFDEWAAYGRGLQLVDRALRWVVGDWLCYGEARWGDMYAQAIEATGLATQSLLNCKWVAQRVPASRRREELPWSHHAEVASLEPEEQEDWLSAAQEEGWTRAELRQAIKPTNPGNWKAELLDVLRVLAELSEGRARDLAERAVGILKEHM